MRALKPRRPAWVHVLALVLVWLVLASTAQAAAPSGPQWTVSSVSGPTNFVPGEEGRYVVTATNVGDQPTSGEVVLEDTLPEGLTETQISGSEAFAEGAMSCTTVSERQFRCAFAGQVAPADTLTVVIGLQVGAGLPEGRLAQINEATVSGGGAAPASTGEPETSPTTVSSSPARFGISRFSTSVSTDSAAAHPNLTTAFAVNREALNRPADGIRDVGFDLPPGLIGNPLAGPRCDISDVTLRRCPEDTAVGVAVVTIEGSGGSESTYKTLVYDIAPYPGEPAAFAFQLVNGEVTVRLDTSVAVNAAGEYVVHVSVPEVSEAEPVLATSVTLWGVPASQNGPGPNLAEGGGVSFGGPGTEFSVAEPFLRNPSRCGVQGASTLALDSWQEPGPTDTAGAPQLADPRWSTATSPLPASLEGFAECALLAPLFTPSIEVSADDAQAGAPAGYEVGVTVPQSKNPNGPATPDLKDATVALPRGVVASPSAANGLLTCSDGQFGLPPAPTALQPAACPAGSKLGQVEIETPLLAKPLQGQVFLAAPECSPCGSQEAGEGRMLRVFLQAQYGSGSSVRVKLAGRVRIDQPTGRLTTVFQDNPQLPFEHLTVRLKGGPGAPLANPVACGALVTNSQLSPWSGGPAGEPTSSFGVSFDGKGSSCPATLPFGPSFEAQTSRPVAGAFSPFTLSFARNDREQELTGIDVHTPPGLLGMLSSVVLCPEPAASAGTCGPDSQIGEVTVLAGPGSDPFQVTGGRVYLSGPYAGAPFGLSIVVPVVAGPFDLGSEVVRSKIEVDPTTAALSISTPSLPRSRDGVPFQVRAVNVLVDRPSFMFNPTNCAGQTLTAAISGSQGAVAGVASPFAVGNCAGLAFDPGFAVQTSAKTSRKTGASLHVTVTSGAGQANIKTVHVSLPKQLPSRLSTLKLACTEAQFAANPAACPAGSMVGTATAATPVLPVPLSGPAIFVSHGGAAFPDLDVVLQGDGVTVVLRGSTFINEAGITSSTFATVPDVPVERFDLTLPQGPHSALAAVGNLCAAGRTATVTKRVRRRVKGRLRTVSRKVKKRTPALTMPTTILGQNGRRVTRSTRISVSGCAKPKKRVAAKKAKPRRAGASAHLSKAHRRSELQ